MTHDDTEKIGQEQLSTAPLQVLQGLLSGESVTAAAKAGQASRETVHRWLRDDFEFQAAYNRGRREIIEEIQDALLMTAREAVDKVGEAVRSGDVRVALAVLKGAGGLEGHSPRIGSGDPDLLQKEADIERNEEEAMMAIRALSATF